MTTSHVIHRRWTLFERFILYGLVGFAAEICFTASWEAVEFGNRKLVGVTSMYIFFVYGVSILVLERLYLRLKGRQNDAKLALDKLTSNTEIPMIMRGLLYVFVCYIWEFTSGWILKRWDACPWDYESYFQYHFMGLITFEYIPVWYLASLLCEVFVIRSALQAAWLQQKEVLE